MPLIDAIGQHHSIIETRLEAPRIVCLVPSITELLCDLGLAQYLVGRTGFCIHPAEIVSGIPKIGGTKDVNIEKIRGLFPTHLLVNVDENEKPTVDLLREFIPHIIVTHPLTPLDNLRLYRLLGDIFGVPMRAKELCDSFQHAYAQLPPVNSTQTMLYCIWKDPWMTVSADTYISNMLALKGWKSWSSPTSLLRYPQFEWTQELLATIDGVLLSSEPYRFTTAHVDALEQQLNKPVWLVDGEMLSWYGSRAIAGLRYLSQL